MKQIYIVMSNGYRDKPLMAYEERNDAVMAVRSSFKCDEAEAGDLICPVFFMAESGKGAEDGR